MPLIWSKLKPGRTLFINQTPYRYFPYEHHTTAFGLSITCRINGAYFWRVI